MKKNGANYMLVIEPRVDFSSPLNLNTKEVAGKLTVDVELIKTDVTMGFPNYFLYLK